MPRPAPAIAITDARAREAAAKQATAASELTEDQEPDEELQVACDGIETAFLSAEADVERLGCTVEAIGGAALRGDVTDSQR